MSNIWIEVLQSPDQSEIPTPDSSSYHWQAMFACQVGVMSHQNWTNLRWGFNAGALFEEAMERQRLFLESQHSFNTEMRVENPQIRAFAFRYINTNGGLLITLIGKVSAKTREQVELFANDYYHELKTTFPYDYSLSPATSRDEFLGITGSDLLLSGRQIYIAQIKRCETPIPLYEQIPFVQGLWQSNGRAHEQIWRSVNAAKSNILIDIVLRPTILNNNELENYSNLAAEISKYQPDDGSQKVFNAYAEWQDNFIKRRLIPWKKFYYLQFFVVSDHDIPENLIRSIGTVLTQGTSSSFIQGTSSTVPGYQAVKPPSRKEKEWGEKIYNMYLTSLGSQLPDARLSDVADLDEVFSVVRIPYSPPGSQLPDTRLSDVADLDEVLSGVRMPYSPPGSELLGFKYLPRKTE